MRTATKQDKSLVIEIIAESFYTNPSVNMVIKQDSKKTKRIRALANYSFKTALRRNGVFISDDNKGVAICYKYNIKKEGIADYWNQMVLAFAAIGVRRVGKVLSRESHFKQQRPSDGNFLYFWFLGVVNSGKGRGAAIELKNGLLSKSAKEKLPIYLETSVTQNKRVYERYGFETYHLHIREGIEIYCMRRK